MSNIVTQITAMIKDSVKLTGFDLWGVEFIPGRTSILRIYIDNPEKGVNIEDCAEVSRFVSSILDVEDPISQEYNLEVSSPGVDKPMFTLEQYAQYVNSFVTIHLRIAQENSRRYTGKLIKVTNSSLVLSLEELPKKNAKATKAVDAVAEEPTIIEVAFTNVMRGNLREI